MKKGYVDREIGVDVHLDIPVHLFYFILGFCVNTGITPAAFFDSALRFALDILLGELTAEEAPLAT